jgi:hypothetical protein
MVKLMCMITRLVVFLAKEDEFNKLSAGLESITFAVYIAAAEAVIKCMELSEKATARLLEGTKDWIRQLKEFDRSRHLRRAHLVGVGGWGPTKLPEILGLNIFHDLVIAVSGQRFCKWLGEPQPNYRSRLKFTEMLAGLNIFHYAVIAVSGQRL